MKAKLQRLLCTVLCIVLCLSLMPVNTQAADYSGGGNYVAFRSDSPFSISVSTKRWQGRIYYSYDGSSWRGPWTGGKLSANANGSDYVLLLRGEDNTHIIGPSGSTWTLDAEGLVECSGNIMTLLDYEHPESVEMTEYAFSSMFGGSNGWTALVSAPSLPAMKLATACYYGMFSNCTNLREAPALPATALEERCYEYMFYNCSSLTYAPYLPADTMKFLCYSKMFMDCTNLREAPVLRATTLAHSCYSEMFSGCTGLETASELPATTLDRACYSAMFRNCTSLEAAPALPATTLAASCYSSMFSGCTSLKLPPELPATTLTEYCYSSMFYGCTGLKKAPALPATKLAQYCYSSMFYGCTGLKRAPELPATGVYQYGYERMFCGCTGLKLNKTGDGDTWSLPRAASGGAGWNTNMLLNTGGDADATPWGGTVYYYAEPLADYTVSFEMNGHGSAPEAQTVEEGAAAQQPAEPAEEGWTFTGWYADSALETPFDFTAPITSDTVIYAGWKEVATEFSGGTTHITVTVPECSYTLTIPSDTDIPYGAQSLPLGNITVSSVQGLGSKAIYVSIEHTPMLCGQNAISYDISGKLETVGPNGSGTGVWNDLGAIDQSTGPICICDNQHLSYTLALTATIAQNAWNSAPAGTYEGHVNYTFSVN